MMNIEGSHTFDARPEEVWKVMIDPKYLQSALPGCESLEEQAPGQYEATLKIGIGAVKGTYKGKVEIADPEPPHKYVLKGEGSGKPGFVKGESLLEFSNQNGQTVVTYHGTMQVGGLVAGVGQRMIGGVAKMMLAKFFKQMAKNLEAVG